MKQPWTCLGKKKINLVVFHQKYPVLPEVHTIVGLVEEITGKEIDFQVIENLYVDGLVKVARNYMPKHILKIKASQVGYVNELIAHECGHVLRIMSARKSDRLAPCSTVANKIDIKAELDAEESHLTEEMKVQLFDLWVDGLLLQVTNLGVDVRIEKWIYDSYPGLRKSQEEFLRESSKNSLRSFAKAFELFVPKKVFFCSMAMNYAYLTAIGKIINEDFTQYFINHQQVIEYGKVLYKLLEEPDRGYLHDIETTNYWAKILGLTTWFSWIDYENVPEGYGE